MTEILESNYILIHTNIHHILHTLFATLICTLESMQSCHHNMLANVQCCLALYLFVAEEQLSSDFCMEHHHLSHFRQQQKGVHVASLTQTLFPHILP